MFASFDGDQDRSSMTKAAAMDALRRKIDMSGKSPAYP
jgi:hypothetical protein